MNFAPLSIGMVTGEYPPIDGGVGAFTSIISKELLLLGHSVRVFTRTIAASTEPSQAPEVFGAVGSTWGWDTNRRVCKWAVSNDLDIVIIQFQTAAYNMHPAIHWTPATLGRRSIPTIVTFHDLRIPYLFPKAGAVRNWIVRKLARDASGVICTYAEDYDELSSDPQISYIKNIPIGSNIRPHRFPDSTRTRIRREMSVSDAQPLIGFFGFVNRTKGVDVLLDALDFLSKRGLNAELLIVGGHASGETEGSSTLRKELAKKISRMDLERRVHWTGFLPETGVGEILFACDVIALPFVDGVTLRSGTLMAALAFGKAIVTTDADREIPELRDVVAFVPRNDAVALADKIESIWRDDAYRRKLEVSAAETTAKNFSWRIIATRTADFCAQICDSGTQKRY